MTKRPISDKTKHRYAIEGAAVIAKAFKNSQPIQAGLKALKAQLRNAAATNDPKRKKVLLALAALSLAGIEQCIKDGGVYVKANHRKLELREMRILGGQE